jgi:hypothetical protein
MHLCWIIWVTITPDILLLPMRTIGQSYLVRLTFGYMGTRILQQTFSGMGAELFPIRGVTQVKAQASILSAWWWFEGK